MIDRVDLLIAVIGIVVSVVGSTTAMWVGLSKKADKADVARIEIKLDTVIDRLDHKSDRADMARLEAKLDGLILRMIPEAPRP